MLVGVEMRSAHGLRTYRVRMTGGAEDGDVVLMCDTGVTGT